MNELEDIAKRLDEKYNKLCLGNGPELGTHNANNEAASDLLSFAQWAKGFNAVQNRSNARNQTEGWVADQEAINGLRKNLDSLSAVSTKLQNIINNRSNSFDSKSTESKPLIDFDVRSEAIEERSYSETFNTNAFEEVSTFDISKKRRSNSLNKAFVSTSDSIINSANGIAKSGQRMIEDAPVKETDELETDGSLSSESLEVETIKKRRRFVMATPIYIADAEEAAMRLDVEIDAPFEKLRERRRKVIGFYDNFFQVLECQRVEIESIRKSPVTQTSGAKIPHTSKVTIQQAITIMDTEAGTHSRKEDESAMKSLRIPSISEQLPHKTGKVGTLESMGKLPSSLRHSVSHPKDRRRLMDVIRLTDENIIEGSRSKLRRLLPANCAPEFIMDPGPPVDAKAMEEYKAVLRLGIGLGSRSSYYILRYLLSQDIDKLCESSQEQEQLKNLPSEVKMEMLMYLNILLSLPSRIIEELTGKILLVLMVNNAPLPLLNDVIDVFLETKKFGVEWSSTEKMRCLLICALTSSGYRKPDVLDQITEELADSNCFLSLYLFALERIACSSFNQRFSVIEERGLLPVWPHEWNSEQYYLSARPTSIDFDDCTAKFISVFSSETIEQITLDELIGLLSTDLDLRKLRAGIMLAKTASSACYKLRTSCNQQEGFETNFRGSAEKTLLVLEFYMAVGLLNASVSTLVRLCWSSINVMDKEAQMILCEVSALIYAHLQEEEKLRLQKTLFNDLRAGCKLSHTRRWLIILYIVIKTTGNVEEMLTKAAISKLCKSVWKSTVKRMESLNLNVRVCTTTSLYSWRIKF